MKEHGSAPQYLLVGRWFATRYSLYTYLRMDWLSSLWCDSWGPLHISLKLGWANMHANLWKTDFPTVPSGRWNRKNTMFAIAFLDKAFTHCARSLSPLSLTNNGHYQLASKVLPLLQRSLHLGAAHVGNLSYTKVLVYLSLVSKRLLPYVLTKPQEWLIWKI